MVTQPNIALALNEEVARLYAHILREKSMLDRALQLFLDSPVYTVTGNNGTIEEYQYFIYPFKGSTLADHSLYAKISSYLAKMIPKETEVILTIEADGIGVASFIGAELALPIIICKSFHYNVPSIEFSQVAGYHKRTMYMPKIIQGKKVAIVDCMISTGGTIRAMLDAVRTLPGTQITGVYCINNKSNYGDQTETFDGFHYKYIFDTKINSQNQVEAEFSKALKPTFWEQMDKEFFELAKGYASLSNFSRNGYQVGAIIVASDTFEIVAHGYRRGNIHAEHDAITMLKNNCPDWEHREFTLYVTLEPCIYRNGSGYTPCAELINDIPQIRWVVIGSLDNMDEKIYRKGIEKLRQKKHIRLLETGEVLRSYHDVPHFLDHPHFSKKQVCEL